MRLDWVRLTLRLNRFELLAFGIGIGALVVAAFAAAAYIEGLRPGSDCYAIAGALPPACEEAVRRFYEAQSTLSGLVLPPLLGVTYAAGLFLGVPIVARELERGTVRLAWSLAPSRWRWFVARAIPILVVLIVLTFAAGVAADRLFAASTPGAPGVDLSRSFDGYGARGGLLASRAVFVFAVSVVVGSVVGRALPALIVAALVAWIGLFGGIKVHERILQGEAVAVPSDQDFNGGGSSGDMFIDQKFVLPDGTLVGWTYFNGSDPFDQNGNPLYPMVSMVIPGERYRSVETREALVLAGGSLAGLALAAFVVSRRRPG
jgi:hypothetical protein